MVTEGIDKQPLRYIVSELVKEKFNCVRFTWATHMFTRYSKRTVLNSLKSFNLTKSIAGIAKNNNFLLRLTLVDAFEAVVDEFGKQGVMVVFDNQVSRPTWCCGYDDGNGFFGDKDFDVEEWLRGLTMIAKRFRGRHNVIGISTRNEIRGPRSNEEDWYKYMEQGIETIHKANPHVLIFASGLGYASDLTFLKKKPLETSFNNKLVYEAHWYPFSWGHGGYWSMEDVNGVCYNETQRVFNQTGFVMNAEKPFPMFMGEFGLVQRAFSRGDERFLACFLAYAAEFDLEWGLWAWQGSYHYRENQIGMEETYGVMDYNWDRVRNPEYQRRMELIKLKLQDPSLKSQVSRIMFHPQSGTCISADGTEGISAGDCKAPSHWVHTRDGDPIRLKGKRLCIKVVSNGWEPMLSEDCSSEQSSWKKLSKTKFHFASVDDKGQQVCLQKESPYTRKIITRNCTLMLEDAEYLKSPLNEPVAQWFKFVETNVL
ncbi:hypothetical protein JCGZ_20523 [Jatropha curcas]|uniref:Glycoside hydrolase family 5 domain-containing protein n=1 Tax=Jatropha curcas TaxID=180498 RepID=A0A067JNB5_JATCU|nr:hypothetical protein JCGZ_20523 [Jatropha curcas]